MKQKRLYILLFVSLMIAVPINAQTIDISLEANNDINAIEKNKELLEETIKNRTPKKINKFDISDIHKEIQNELQEEVVLDNDNQCIKFTKVNKSNEGVEYIDKLQVSNMAFEFCDRISTPLSANESLEKLYVKLEQSIHEELDEKGNVKDDTHLRTHSAVVKLGRKFYDKPIFNTYATIGFDAVDNSVTYLDFKNWLPLNLEADIKNIKNVNKKNIEEKISRKINDKINKEKKYKIIKVNEVKLGWYIQKDKSLNAAIIFHVDAFEDENSINPDKKSALEIL